MPSKHTPGPWQWYWRTANPEEAGDIADCGVFWEKRKGQAVSICRAPRYEKREQWEANARLIAAAPDLLEALAEFSIKDCAHCEATGREPRTTEDACHICGGCGEVFTGGWPPMVRAAIAKAEGE